MRPDAPGRRRRSSLLALSSIILSLIWGLAPAPSAAGERGERAGATIEPVDLDDAGTGVLLRRTPEGLVPLPILDLEIRLQVTGVLVHGTITESFTNPTPGVIEAVYVLPLPERAAVHHMEIRIGPRRIESVIRERQEAQHLYQEAKSDERKAALVEQRRANLFTAAAANVNPGEQVDVVIDYLQELSCDDGVFSLAFPLTLTPRFAPPAAAPVEEPPAVAPARTPFAPAGSPAVPRARLVVRLDEALPLQNIASESHALRRFWEGRTLVVEPQEGRIPADRDFLLRWQAAPSAAPRPVAFVEERPDGRYLLLMLMPPADDSAAARGLPTETVFVVDVSGSMEGPSIDAARAALLAALDRLRPDDAFALVAFDDGLREFRPALLPGSAGNLEAARAWARGLAAGGGTMIVPALRRALDLARSGADGRVRRIVFLTDGAVENEEEVLRIAHGDLGAVRLHVLGIGAAPNRPLMRELAARGRGLSSFIATSSGAGNAVESFFERLDRPVMTDLALQWIGVSPDEVYPSLLPDLHAGEPLLVSARLAAPGAGPASGGRVLLTGLVLDRPARFELPLDPGAAPGSGVAVRWARARVAALLDAQARGAGFAAVRDAVVEVSTRFSLVTPFTSLVAVEEFPTARGHARSVAVPNGLPVGTPPGILPLTGSDEPRLFVIGCLLCILGFLVLRLETIT